MSNLEPLTPKIPYWRAAICYLSGCLYLVTSIIYVFAGQKPFLFMLTVGLLFLAPPLAWLLSYRVHPFVDAAGKRAINLLLNFLVAGISTLLFSWFALSILCGSGAGRSEAIGIIVFLMMAVILMTLIFAYFLFSLAGAWRALRGESVEFPILPLIRS